MTRFALGYDVARPTGTCAAAGTPLEPGSACIATLCEREEDDGFDRLDFSVEAWDAGHRPDRLFSFWQTVVPEPNEKRRVFVDDETLMDLFMRLDGDDRPQRRAFRFVLGLVLVRKRLLRQVGRRTDGQGEEQRTYWLLRARGSDREAPPLDLLDPRISDDDVQAIVEQLADVLDPDF